MRFQIQVNYLFMNRKTEYLNHLCRFQ